MSKCFCGIFYEKAPKCNGNCLRCAQFPTECNGVYEQAVGDEYDYVHQPKHYEVMPGVEAKSIIASVLNEEDGVELTPFESYCIGNALKYLLRCRKKGNFEQDIAKANTYLSFILKGSDV